MPSSVVLFVHVEGSLMSAHPVSLLSPVTEIRGARIGLTRFENCDVSSHIPTVAFHDAPFGQGVVPEGEKVGYGRNRRVRVMSVMTSRMNPLSVPAGILEAPRGC